MKLLYGLSCLAWILLEVWIFYRERGNVNKKTDNNTRQITLFSVILGIVLGNIFANVNLFAMGGANTRFLIGTIIIWLGWALRLWSVQTLGKFFRTTVMIQKEHVVIESGPYRILRHPSYAGGLVMLTGVSIGMGNWIGLVLMEIIAFVGFSLRISLEEKTLSQSLGQDYRNYMKRTKKLIPFIY